MVNLVFERNPYPRSKPKVTIGICVKDCEKYIRDAINSVINQDFPHRLMEILIVDDGSEDKTLSIVLNSVSRIDIPVKVFHSKWRGLGPSRNIIVNNAHGDYILWVDGDMILPADHVRKQVIFMEQHTKVGIAKARHGIILEDGLVAVLESIPFVVIDADWKKMSFKMPGTGGAIFRVRAIKQVGGFDDSLKGTGEDQDIAYRVKAAGWLISQSPAVFYERRVRTWKDLWKKYTWYGYGDHDLYCKNRNIFSLYKMNPIAGFLAGAFNLCDGFRLTKYEGAFLLPLHFAFKLTAWCSGFTKARMRFLRFNRKKKQTIKRKVNEI